MFHLCVKVVVSNVHGSDGDVGMVEVLAVTQHGGCLVGIVGHLQHVTSLNMTCLRATQHDGDSKVSLTWSMVPTLPVSVVLWPCRALKWEMSMWMEILQCQVSGVR